MIRVSPGTRYERRHFKRYDLAGVAGAMQKTPGLVVLNMSLTGLAVESTEPMRIGESYPLTMEGNTDMIEVPAEVKWCCMIGHRENVHGSRENIYQIGLDFSGVQGQKAQEILHFMQGHIIADVTDRVVGRFHPKKPKPSEIANDEPLDFNLPHFFLVKRISFASVLIETEPALLPSPDTIVDIEINHEKLHLACAARVSDLHGCENVDGETLCDVDLEFQELSIDDCLALDYFIRDLLE